MPYVTADRSLPRSLDLTITLSRPAAETRTSLDILCVACTDIGFLPNANRIRFYSTLDSLTDDHGTSGEAYRAGATFFAQSPRSTYIAIGEVFETDQPAMLVSPEFTAAQIAAAELITDGGIKITYDIGAGDVEQEITGIDFDGASDVDDLVDAINTALGSDSGLDIECVAKTLPGGTARVCFQTITAGDDITIEYAEAASSGTDVSALLQLTSATGATICNGYAPTGIADELQSLANAALAVDKYIMGWSLAESLRDVAKQTAAAAWVLAREYGIMELTSNDTNALDPTYTTDIGSVVLATENRRVALFYHDNSQRYPGVSILAYMLSVNYRLKNSVATAKFKQMPGIETVQLTETEWTALQAKGYNTYTAIGNDASTNRDGTVADSGWYIDTTINLDNFREDLSVNAYNVFLRNKVVPNTKRGQQLFVDAITDTCEQYVYNGCFAERETADTTYKSGYRVIPAYLIEPSPMWLQSDADRASRIGAPIGVTVYEAGAIHSIAINVEVVQ